MLLNDILLKVDAAEFPSILKKVDITDVCADSRRLKTGAATAFFAYKGSHFDSHDLAVELYRTGKVAAVVAERAIGGMPAVVVKEGRQAFALACAKFFGRPDSQLTMIGVTGTNGKTTTTYIIEKIFQAAGINAVRVGTTGADVVGTFRELDNTTPSAYDFFEILNEGIKKGAGMAVAEVSSHALDQDRLHGVIFDAGVFTNITGDHLDYHKDMEEYYEVKKRLFSTERSRKQIINLTHPYGKRLYEEIDGEKYSFGIEEGDLRVVNYSMSFEGITAELSYKGSEFKIKSPLVGDFNLENILGAACAALALDIAIADVIKGIATLQNIPGRLEKYRNNGITVFVDYAHTDDALENVLSTLRKLAAGKLVTVFGAGGDRDKTKRPRMGKIAQKYSDITVVTSDNPRTEQVDAIIKDITDGMNMNSTVYVEPDREKAIALAISLCKEGDVAIVAGKGHEEYQIIGRVKHPFSDSKYVELYLKSK